MSEPVVPLDAKLLPWIGRTTTASDIVTSAMLDGFLALLDHETPAGTGSAAPQGIHWLCATPRVRARDIGADGHPHQGLLLPPVDLPRRMWAGSAIEFLKPICQGDAIERHSTIRSITPKTGSAGALVFVEIDHSFHANGEVALNERHTIVYRSPPDMSRRAAGDTQHPEKMPPETTTAAPAFSRIIRPDPVLLFRYSALTFNSHRIHYDHPYVTKVEGYPGLVVHGPLIATLLLDMAASVCGANAVKTFSFRGLAPAFAGDALSLEGYFGGIGLRLRAVAEDGRVAVTAEAKL
jgi:3-methylfumaryl-CoA hydratase